MIISTGEKQISSALENGEEDSLKSFPLESNPDSIFSVEKQMSSPLENGGESLKSFPLVDGKSPTSPFPESPLVFDTFTDVSVVPEHEKDQLEQTILNLEGEIVDLRLKQRSLHEKRRQALNKILEIKGCIRVFCRIRPFLSRNKRIIHQPISVESERIVIRSGGSRKEYGFDKVFPQETSQEDGCTLNIKEHLSVIKDIIVPEYSAEDVFVEVEPILRSALDGRNVCILAYGQTGTGKTFTMDGTNETPGIVPRVLKKLFQEATVDVTTSVTFSMSMLEVYLGSIRDLLAPKPASRAFTVSKCNLNIQTDTKGLVEIEGLTEVQISDFAKAAWWYNKGRRVRSTSWTNVNEASSRSHCLTRITIYRLGDASGGKPEVSKLWMVDLGGSERLLKTGATGQTLDEGRAINLSLSALGDVIAALRRKRGHIPYRNSKLTQILKDSLGDGSKVLMIVHASPNDEDVMETTCSFTFARRARAVESNRELTENTKMQKDQKIAELQEEMKEAEKEIDNIRIQIQKAELLLSEKKKLFDMTYHIVEDEEDIPRSPKQCLKGVLETPLISEMPISTCFPNSAPRFMNSTVASRQRHNAAEKETKGRARSLRSVTRTFVQISSSQSLSYSDPRFKAFLRHPNKKSRYGETNTNTPLTEIALCNGSNFMPSAVAGAKMVSSDPNLRVTLHQHRRRMSDLI